MKSKKIILAGAFSFCLPGLGQLFLNRPLSSVVFFTLFIIAELNPPYLKLISNKYVVSMCLIKEKKKTRYYYF